ncbi:MAG: transporter substrate-binding domain-containing protein [Bacteriovoracaceae bacterium]|nr:transporter substrate-binding domain-containing protein [Bacteriovoracaceae bacterium]
MYKLFLIIIGCLTIISNAECYQINVGVYQNLPKVFIDENKKPGGFFVDLLEHIAKKEKWQLNYVECNWNNCLNMVEKGELDLFLDVAFSKKREKKFIFNKEVALFSWSRIYRRRKLIINSFIDLSDKTIGILKGSIQMNKIKNITAGYGFKPKYVYFDSFEEMFSSVGNGKVDTIVVNKFIGKENEKKYNMIKTNIALSPTNLHYIIPKRGNKKLLNTIDKYLILLKNDKKSAYYKTLNKWITQKESLIIPFWMYILLFCLLVVIFVIHLFNNHLKKVVKARSEQLANSMNMAFIGMNTSEIIHNLNNPLTSLLTRAEMLLKTYPHDKNVKKLISASNKIKQTIGSILKKTRTNYNESLQETNINDILIEELELFKIRPFFKNEVNLKLELNDIKPVLAVPNHFNQITGNILENAIDSMIGRETRELLIKTSSQNKRVKVEISDTGCGISQNNLNKIFDPLFTTKTYKEGGNKPVGTGLGLYSAKRMIESYRGDISIASSQGKGTTVSFTIPV